VPRVRRAQAVSSPDAPVSRVPCTASLGSPRPGSGPGPARWRSGPGTLHTRPSYPDTLYPIPWPWWREAAPQAGWRLPAQGVRERGGVEGGRWGGGEREREREGGRDRERERARECGALTRDSPPLDAPPALRPFPGAPPRSEERSVELRPRARRSANQNAPGPPGRPPNLARPRARVTC